MRLRGIVQVQRSSADRIVVGDTAIVPQSRALVVRLPRGGIVWNRPTAIIVERGGRTERIRIVDATRRAQAAIFGLLLASFVASRILKSRTRSRR